VWKGSIMRTELNKSFVFDFSKTMLKINDNVKEDIKCVNCNINANSEKCHEVPLKYFIKYNTYLRTKSQFEKLTQDINEMLYYIKPVVILETVCDNKKSENKSEFLNGFKTSRPLTHNNGIDFKIGVRYCIYYCNKIVDEK
jgi:hypothetical protein